MAVATLVLITATTVVAEEATYAWRIAPPRTIAEVPAQVTPETDITMIVNGKTVVRSRANVVGLSEHPTLEEAMKYLADLVGKKEVAPEDQPLVQDVAMATLVASETGGELDTATSALLQKLLEKYPVDKSRKVVSKGNSGIAYTAGGDMTVTNIESPLSSLLDGGVHGTKRVLVHERRVTPAIRGFGALGTHHSNHSPEWHERKRFRGLRLR